MTVAIAKVSGLDVLNKRLLDIPHKLRRRALRNSLAAGARIVRDAERESLTAQRGGASMKTLKSFYAEWQRAGNASYIPGTVENAIRVRTSKRDTAAGDVGVFVNVKPLSGDPGRHNPNDPFYWRWVELGSSKWRGHPFMRQAQSVLPEALSVFEKTLGPQIQRLDVNGDDPL